MSLQDQIAAASGGIGVVLVLISLFTSEQARRNDTERVRTGGPKQSSAMATCRISIALAVTTSLALVALAPLAIDVIGTCCSGRWRADSAIFVLLWLLLVPLVAWQVGIAKEAWRLWRPKTDRNG